MCASHARDRKAADRAFAGVVIRPALPVGIGHDRLAPDLVKGDVLGRMARRGGDRESAEDAIRIARRPLQHLHAPHRAADHGEEPLDAELIQKPRLHPDHVADGDDRKAETVGFLGVARDFHRP